MSRYDREPNLPEHEYGANIHCPCCGQEIDYDETVYDYEGTIMCSDCFQNFCIENLDLTEMAKLHGAVIGRAFDELYE